MNATAASVIHNSSSAQPLAAASQQPVVAAVPATELPAPWAAHCQRLQEEAAQVAKEQPESPDAQWRERALQAAKELEQAAQALRKMAGQESDPVAAPRNRLKVAPNCAWFEINGGERVDLRRRRTLRRILHQLVSLRNRQVGQSLSVPDLFCLGWPDEKATPASAAGRVYTSIRLLRRLGLRPVLLCDDSGYLLDPNWDLEEFTPRESTEIPVQTI